VYARRPDDSEGLIHHSVRGSQYVSIRYAERPGGGGIDPSVAAPGKQWDPQRWPPWIGTLDSITSDRRDRCGISRRQELGQTTTRKSTARQYGGLT
jgi:hypothetical protein